MTAEAYSQIYQVGEDVEINLSSDPYKQRWVAGKVLSVGHSPIGKITYWVKVVRRKHLGINYTLRRPTPLAADVKPRTAQEELDQLGEQLAANHAKIKAALRG